MKADSQMMQNIQELARELDALDQRLSQPDLHPRDISALSKRKVQLQEELKSMTSVNSSGPLEPDQYINIKQLWGDKLELAPPPMNGEWLPRSAVYALVDLMVVVSGRPKGLFKECSKRIESGMLIVQGQCFFDTIPSIRVSKVIFLPRSAACVIPFANHSRVNLKTSLHDSVVLLCDLHMSALRKHTCSNNLNHVIFTDELVKLGITDNVKGKLLLEHQKSWAPFLCIKLNDLPASKFLFFGRGGFATFCYLDGWCIFNAADAIS